MTPLVEQLGLVVFRHRETGVWGVPSRELARVTAHKHYNILAAARKAEREMDVGRVLIWGTYVAQQQNKRVHPCCWIPREVLARMRLNNLAGCRIVPEIIGEYLRLLDMHEAAQPANPRTPWLKLFRERQAAETAPETAPDSEIRPPDPEPADTLLPASEGWVSWEIKRAIELLAGHGAPDEAIRRLERWNNDRQWFELQKRAQSWTQVHALYATATPMARP